MKKNKSILLFVAVILTLTSVTGVFAQADPNVTLVNTGYKVEKIWPASHYLGTLRSYMDDIQKLPGEMDEYLCDKKETEYKERYALLNKRIADVTWLMEEMNLKNDMNLQRIVNVFIRTKACGVGKLATHYADYARERLNIQLEKSGLE